MQIHTFFIFMKNLSDFLKGLFLYCLIDVISALTITIVWNWMISSAFFPEINFIQAIGGILIFDILMIASDYRKDYSENLEK